MVSQEGRGREGEPAASLKTPPLETPYALGILHVPHEVALQSDFRTVLRGQVHLQIVHRASVLRRVPPWAPDLLVVPAPAHAGLGRADQRQADGAGVERRPVVLRDVHQHT